MGLRNELSAAQRNEIIGVHKNGVPLTEISGNAPFSYGTAKYTWQQRNIRPKTQETRPGRGYKPKYSPRSQKALYRVVRDEPKITYY